jgi:hypothetical protein
MRKFVNERLAAPNVFTVPIDLEIARTLSSVASGRWRLYTRSPQWRSDIRWYSPRSRRDFDRFRSIFERLDIARHVEPYVDFNDRIRLFNGMLIVRSNCREPDFHTDWFENGNQGFTLMAPLSENCRGFGLLYKRIDGTIAEYEYRLGEALIFGDDFVHSTKPGTSRDPVVFICFNFGTDKMEYWPGIARTAGKQALLTCRPDGKFHRMPVLRRMRIALGSAVRTIGLRSNRRDPISKDHLAALRLQQKPGYARRSRGSRRTSPARATINRRNRRPSSA